MLAQNRKGQTAASDTELVRRVRAGRQEAYRLIVDRHGPMVFRLVGRFTRDHADAQDLAQEIFVKAYHALDRFKDGTSFTAWLYTIGINHCRDYAKNIRRAVRPMSQMESVEYSASLTQEATQQDEMEHSERALRVRWAIAQLPADYATPFLLKYEEGLPYQDIAQMMNTTVGALKVRVHRARQELQRLMTEGS